MRKRRMDNQILFICTGNYYRSRFAEAVFNHHAKAHGLPWRAFSRGLAIHLVPPEYLLSPDTHDHLVARKIETHHTAPGRAQLSEEDLQGAKIIVALKDGEHRPMVREMFPEWEHEIVFWDVDDQPQLSPREGLAAIEKLVLSLIEDLRATA